MKLPNPAVLENLLYSIECLASNTTDLPGNQILREVQHLMNTLTCRLNENQCSRLLGVFKLAVQYGTPDPIQLETAALALARGLIVHGMRPDLETFGFVMTPPDKKTGTERSPEGTAFRILLGAYCNLVSGVSQRGGTISKDEAVAQAWKLFDELKRLGKKPDTQDMLLMMALMEKCKSVSDLERAFKEAQGLGIVAPGTSMLNLRIQGMQNIDPHRGLQLFEEARIAGGVRPNQTTFLMLLNCCAKLKDPERALQLFDEFTKKLNVKLDASCFVLLMDLMVECDSASGFSRVEKEMRSVSIMTTKLWNTLIQGYDRFHKSMDKAMSVLSEMRTRGDRPNEATLMALLNACYRRRDIDRAHQLLNSMRSEGVEIQLVHFLNVLQCAVESHNPDKFEKTVKLMEESQVPCDRSLRLKISQQRATLTNL